LAPAAMASTLLLVGCSTPQLPNSQTASEQFSRLGPAEKRVASTFYDLGQGTRLSAFIGHSAGHRKAGARWMRSLQLACNGSM
jgi:hypothetical protein